MSGMEIFALVYASANIGLLCSIKFDLGVLKEKTDNHDKRLTKVEEKLA